jgi:hypothetical protein
MLSDAWNNPAGGLRYHFRAWRHSRDWQAYRKGLHEWLSGWHPGRSTLALVGPSAGYCLPFEALEGFERLVVFEIDPLARLLLRRRIRRALPRSHVTLVSEDKWVGPVRTDGQIPAGLLDPSAAVLFCNFIGQLPGILDPGEYPGFQGVWSKSLFPQLEHTPWASFHDRVSGDTAPYDAPNNHGRRLNDAAGVHHGHPVGELSDHAHVVGDE